MNLGLQINGEQAEVEAHLHDTLLTVLRDQLQLSATKRGCNQGVCGVCTVQVDGWPVRACLSLAHGCEGSHVRTLEGLASSPRMQALVQSALLALEVSGAHPPVPGGSATSCCSINVGLADRPRYDVQLRPKL